jgi:hypothetical protein
LKLHHNDHPVRPDQWLLLTIPAILGLIYVVSRSDFLLRAIKVVRDETTYLELRTGWRTISADKLGRKVSVGRFRIVPFDSIEAVELRTFDRHRGPPFWTISLCLPRKRRLFLARTLDDVEASITAARLGTILETEVVTAG